MIGRAMDAGVPAQWVAADEVYGADPGLRADLEARQVGYVLAIGCDRRVPTAAGPMRADVLAARLPHRAWQRLSVGPGAKGQRYYDWAWVDLTAESGHHWLLVRRHPRHGELAFYRCYCSTAVRLGDLVRVAGRRWTIEESSQAAKGLAGLDDHQVRRWLAWRRWTLRAMLAHALLAVIAATERTEHPPDELIPLTCNEIRHLFTSLITEPTRRLTDLLAWSRWRRRHQHHARASHYRRQQAQLT
jgi:SRSO17 transposase